MAQGSGTANLNLDAHRRNATAMTVVVMAVWVLTVVARLINPNLVVGPAADALATLSAGYWFATRKDKEEAAG